MKKYYCESCKQEFYFEKSVQFGGHRSACKLNPNYEERIKKLSKEHTLKRIKVTKICLKCNNEFEVERTINKDGNERIPKKEKKFCSRKCSNSKDIKK